MREFLSLRRRWLLRPLLALLLVPLTGPVAAQNSTPTAGDLTKSKGFFALPIELDMDSGAANGDASILRIQPVFTVPLNDKWRLLNLSILTLADAPGGTPAFPGDRSSGQTAGVSDFLHSVLATPRDTGNFVLGFGALFSIPTATNKALGFGKWAAGPAVRATYRKGPWNLGVLAGQRWSFAGFDSRKSVNQLIIRGAIRRQLGNDWYFVSSPLITTNWNTKGQKWLVPVGGGIGRRFTLGGNPWAVSAQGYVNAIKPDAAPDWVFRLTVTAAVPYGG